MWQAIGHATARTAHAAKAPVTGATVRLAAISQRRGFFTARVFFAPAGTAKKSKSASKKGSDAPKASKTSAAAKTPATGTADEGRKDRSDASSDRQRNSEAILLERQKRKEEREAKTAERRQKKDKQRMAKARAKARAKATAKNAEVKRKLELEKLKEMSLLEEEPKLGAVNTWGYYVAQHAKGKMSNPEGFTGLVAALQKSYNSMSQAERKSLEDQFEKIQQSNLKIHQAWLQSKTPGEIERANAARSKLKNHFKMKIPARRMLIKDDRIPKKPSAPYNYFFRSRYASAHAGLPVVEAARLIAEKWTTLTDAEKAPYIAASEAQRAKYAEQVQSVLGRKLGRKLGPILRM